MDDKLAAIRDLIDLALAEKPDEEVEANLYSARLHVMLALRETKKAVAA